MPMIRKIAAFLVSQSQMAFKNAGPYQNPTQRDTFVQSNNVFNNPLMRVSAANLLEGTQQNYLNQLKNDVRQAIQTTKPFREPLKLNTKIPNDSVFRNSIDWHSSIENHWAALVLGGMTQDQALLAFVYQRLNPQQLAREMEIIREELDGTELYGKTWFLFLLSELEKHPEYNYGLQVNALKQEIAEILLEHLRKMDGSLSYLSDNYYDSTLFMLWGLAVNRTSLNVAQQQEIEKIFTEKVLPHRQALLAWDYRIRESVAQSERIKNHDGSDGVSLNQTFNKTLTKDSISNQQNALERKQAQEKLQTIWRENNPIETMGMPSGFIHIPSMYRLLENELAPQQAHAPIFANTNEVPELLFKEKQRSVLGGQIMQMWPFANEAAQGSTSSANIFNHRMTEVWRLSQNWRGPENFKPYSHWIPAFITMGYWLAENRP